MVIITFEGTHETLYFTQGKSDKLDTAAKDVYYSSVMMGSFLAYYVPLFQRAVFL